MKYLIKFEIMRSHFEFVILTRDPYFEWNKVQNASENESITQFTRFGCYFIV